MVGVADFLQTDDLYQLAQPRELPELPDFTKLSLLTCGHAALAEACVNRAGVGGHGAAPPGAVVPLSRAADGVPVAPCRRRRFGPPRAADGRARQQRGRADARGGRRRNAATSSSRRGTAGSPPARRSSGPTDDHKPVRSGA